MIKYEKEIRVHKFLAKGYVRFYDREHPLADSCGLVYLHRHVASLKEGRWLKNNKTAHHINGDKEDNRPDNLIVISHLEHIRVHQRERGNIIGDKVCEFCKKTYAAHKKEAKYCSPDCSQEASQKFDISKEDLERLVWEKSTVKIAKDLGVSDVAVAKRCKKFGIKKPPRGYWMKNK